MKGLTLYEPWAVLVVAGLKQYETRSWRVSYRGPLLITASLRFGWQEVELTTTNVFARALTEAGYNTARDLPRGRALGVVDLVEIVPTSDVVHTVSPRELAFGNYGAGRYAWRLANARRFQAPFAIGGHQQLWTLQPFEVQRVEEALAACR